MPKCVLPDHFSPVSNIKLLTQLNECIVLAVYLSIQILKFNFQVKFYLNIISFYKFNGNILNVYA